MPVSRMEPDLSLPPRHRAPPLTLPLKMWGFWMMLFMYARVRTCKQWEWRWNGMAGCSVNKMTFR